MVAANVRQCGSIATLAKRLSEKLQICIATPSCMRVKPWRSKKGVFLLSLGHDLEVKVVAVALLHPRDAPGERPRPMVSRRAQHLHGDGPAPVLLSYGDVHLASLRLLASVWGSPRT